MLFQQISLDFFITTVVTKRISDRVILTHSNSNILPLLSNSNKLCLFSKNVTFGIIYLLTLLTHIRPGCLCPRIFDFEKTQHRVVNRLLSQSSQVVRQLTKSNDFSKRPIRSQEKVYTLTDGRQTDKRTTIRRDVALAKNKEYMISYNDNFSMNGLDIFLRLEDICPSNQLSIRTIVLQDKSSLDICPVIFPPT